MALTLDDKLKSANILTQIAGVGDLPDWSRNRYRQEDIKPQGGNQGEGPTHQKEEQLSIPGLPLELAHDFWDGESLSDKWGAVWNDREGKWLMPPDSPNGNHRFASDEESQMLEEDALHRKQFDRDTPHHWDQAMVNYGKPTGLDKLLGPHQGPGGSLRHMKEDERKNLLIKGTKV